MNAPAIAPRAVDVQLHAISHVFAGENGPLVALQEIDLTIPAGEFVCVVGPSGCGKSTLLRLVAGLETPTQGSILLAGATPTELRAQKAIGWMAQQAALLPWRTVRDNVALPLTVNPQSDRPPVSAADLLALVGLTEFAQAYPQTLSGGMQQRVALARTLAVGAPLWLMDEPFAALDELTRELLAGELLRIWQRYRTTVVWITHHLHEAVRLADQIVLLTPRPGRVAAVLPVDLSRPRDDTSPAFQAIVRQARRLLQGKVEVVA